MQPQWPSPKRPFLGISESPSYNDYAGSREHLLHLLLFAFQSLVLLLEQANALFELDSRAGLAGLFGLRGLGALQKRSSNEYWLDCIVRAAKDLTGESAYSLRGVSMLNLKLRCLKVISSAIAPDGTASMHTSSSSSLASKSAHLRCRFIASSVWQIWQAQERPNKGTRVAMEQNKCKGVPHGDHAKQTHADCCVYQTSPAISC